MLRIATIFTIAGCAIAASVTGADSAAPQPRFAPDVATAWQVDHADGDDFLLPDSGPHAVTYDPAHPFIPTVPDGPNQPTYRIADVTNPILKPWAAEQMRKANQDVLNGGIPYVPRERCWPAGVPAYVLEPPFNISVFIETPKEILMVHQNDFQVRHIYMNVPHTAHPKPSWTGESVGHYERDELVVDTIGLNTRTFVDNYRTPHTGQLHVIERFKLINGGKTLIDTIRVDDPGAFNMPWTAVQRWKRTARGPIEEATCAENNENMFSYKVRPIPTAAKPDF